MFIQLFCLFSVGESVYHKICHSLKQKCPTRLYVKRFVSSAWISKLESPYMSQSTVSSVCVPLSLIDSSSLGEVEKPESPNLQSCGPALESVSTPRTNPSGNAAWVTSQHPHPPPPPANTQSTPPHHFLAAVSSLCPRQTPQWSRKSLTGLSHCPLRQVLQNERDGAGKNRSAGEIEGLLPHLES